MDPIDPKMLVAAAPRPPEPGTWSDESALKIALSRETYNIATDSLRALGVARAEQQEGMRLSLESEERLRPSASLLKVTNDVALLLATWRRDPRYLQADGTPRALPIFGSGASLESLVKFCVPDVPVADVATILCTHSDVRRLNGDKIALLGDPVKITDRNTATSVAYLSAQFRHIAETVVFNTKIPAGARGEGRFERMIWGTLPKKQFEEWSQAVRAPLQVTADRVETDLEQRPSGTDSDDVVCGIGIFVFREDGDLG